MAHFEGYANGPRQHVVYDHSRPGFFNSMPTLPNASTNSGQTSLYDVAAPDSAMYDGRYESDNSGGVTLEHFEPLQNSMWPIYLHDCRLGDRLCLECLHSGPNEGDIFVSEFDVETLLVDEFLDYLYGSGLETQPLDDGYSPLSASGPTTTSSPEYMLERSCCTSDVAKKQIDMIKGVPKEKINRKRKRSVETDKKPCEIRISKKIPKDGRYQREKVWLGTYATPDQAGRALDVGKYFLCTKKKKIFYDPNSEAMLSAFKDHLQALPLTELVEHVTRMAKHYGENGSFTDFQGIEALTKQP